MLAVPQEAIEEGSALKSRRKKDLTVKVVSYDTAKRLGDAICAKYKKAFELLKDK